MQLKKFPVGIENFSKFFKDDYYYVDKTDFIAQLLNYCWSLATNKNARPENYWANTSSNALVRRFIDKADAHTRQEIEQLIDGNAIIKPVRYELTYDELDKSIDNLWNSISIRDTAVRSRYKENFYHGMLLGILQYEHDWSIKSNIESGEGYVDILIETPEYTGVVIDLKYANDANLEPHAKEALEQIDTKQYEARLRDDGMGRIVKIGIAFYKKICRVAVGEIE
jgi:hypothetical protein